MKSIIGIFLGIIAPVLSATALGYEIPTEDPAVQFPYRSNSLHKFFEIGERVRKTQSAGELLNLWIKIRSSGARLPRTNVVLRGYHSYKREGEWIASSMMTLFFKEPEDAHYPAIKVEDPVDVALLDALLSRTKRLAPRMQPHRLTMEVTRFHGMSHTLYNQRDIIAFEVQGKEDGEEREVRLKAVFATGKEVSKRLSKTVRLAVAPEWARLQDDANDGWAGVFVE